MTTLDAELVASVYPLARMTLTLTHTPMNSEAAESLRSALRARLRQCINNRELACLQITESLLDSTAHEVFVEVLNEISSVHQTPRGTTHLLAVPVVFRAPESVDAAGLLRAPAALESETSRNSAMESLNGYLLHWLRGAARVTVAPWLFSPATLQSLTWREWLDVPGILQEQRWREIELMTCDLAIGQDSFSLFYLLLAAETADDSTAEFLTQCQKRRQPTVEQRLLRQLLHNVFPLHSNVWDAAYLGTPQYFHEAVTDGPLVQRTTELFWKIDGALTMGCADVGVSATLVPVEMANASLALKIQLWHKHRKLPAILLEGGASDSVRALVVLAHRVLANFGINQVEIGIPEKEM